MSSNYTQRQHRHNQQSITHVAWNLEDDVDNNSIVALFWNRCWNFVIATGDVSMQW